MRGTWFTSEHGVYLGQLYQYEDCGFWNIAIYNARPEGGLTVAFGGNFSDEFPYENIYGAPVYWRNEIISRDMGIELMCRKLEELEESENAEE